MFWAVYCSLHLNPASRGGLCWPLAAGWADPYTKSHHAPRYRSENKRQDINQTGRHVLSLLCPADIEQKTSIFHTAVRWLRSLSQKCHCRRLDVTQQKKSSEKKRATFVSFQEMWSENHKRVIYNFSSENFTKFILAKSTKNSPKSVGEGPHLRTLVSALHCWKLSGLKVDLSPDMLSPAECRCRMLTNVLM